MIFIVCHVKLAILNAFFSLNLSAYDVLSCMNITYIQPFDDEYSLCLINNFLFFLGTRIKEKV